MRMVGAPATPARLTHVGQVFVMNMTYRDGDQRRAAVDERFEPGEGVLSRGTAELAVSREHPAAGRSGAAIRGGPACRAGRDKRRREIGRIEAGVVGETRDVLLAYRHPGGDVAGGDVLAGQLQGPGARAVRPPTPKEPG
jgi:hypothetical protein